MEGSIGLMILHPLHVEFLQSEHIQGGYDVETVLAELRKLPSEEGFSGLTRLAIFLHDPSLDGSGGAATAESDFHEMLDSIGSASRKALSSGIESHFLAHAIVGFVLSSLLFDCNDEVVRDELSRYEAHAHAAERKGAEGAITSEVASVSARSWRKIARDRAEQHELAKSRYSLFCDRVLRAMLLHD